MGINLTTRVSPSKPGAEIKQFHAATDLVELNHRFRYALPAEIMRFTLAEADRPVVLTNFRPLAVAFLHLISGIKKDIPVIWIDHGFNTRATYQYIEKIVSWLELNLQVYTPRMSEARYRAVHGAIPALDTAQHDDFSRMVKLEPFTRALQDWQPDVWFNGIRHDQNAYRQSLDIFTFGSQQTVRVAPMFHLNETDVKDYIQHHQLPDNDDYFDPTKGEEHRECGLLLPS